MAAHPRADRHPAYLRCAVQPVRHPAAVAKAPQGRAAVVVKQTLDYAQAAMSPRRAAVAAEMPKLGSVAAAAPPAPGEAAARASTVVAAEPTADAAVHQKAQQQEHLPD